MDYAAIAQSRLTGQFQESPKLKALVAAIVDPLRVLEDDADSIGTKRWIDTSEGVQLDGCGYIVGEHRQGRNDDDYRKAIKFRVFVNISDATPRDLIRGLKYLTDPTDCQYIEMYPATAILFTNGYFVPVGIQAQMQDLSPAGISDVPVCVSYAYEPFRFGKEPPPSELFVNNGNDYLEANGSDIQVSTTAIATGGAVFGGVVPSELATGMNDVYLDINGTMTLAVYNPNTVDLLGHEYLTGVYQ